MATDCQTFLQAPSAPEPDRRGIARARPSPAAQVPAPPCELPVLVATRRRDARSRGNSAWVGTRSARGPRCPPGELPVLVATRRRDARSCGNSAWVGTRSARGPRCPPGELPVLVATRRRDARSCGNSAGVGTRRAPRAAPNSARREGGGHATDRGDDAR